VIPRALIPQPHGGALLAGGTPGQKGGPGRPKDALREKMRIALDAALEAILAALAGERLATDATDALLRDPRIVSLGPVAVARIAEVAREHFRATLSPRELIQAHETLAKYGVGLQTQVESKATNTRYVIQLPARRKEHANGPIAVIPPDRTGTE
jgi:hypothetical protein